MSNAPTRRTVLAVVSLVWLGGFGPTALKAYDCRDGKAVDAWI